MEINEYQITAHLTSIYPADLLELECYKNIYYPALGLAGEAGELAGKVSKIMRDKRGIVSDEDRLEILKELGDCAWMMAEVATSLGATLSEVLDMNVKKLAARAKKGTLSGSGDNR